jgi:hypothetical protein
VRKVTVTRKEKEQWEKSNSNKEKSNSNKEKTVIIGEQ